MGILSSLQKPQTGWKLLLIATDNSRSNSRVKFSFPKQTLPLKPPLSFAKLSPTDIPHVDKIEPGLYSGGKRQRVSLQHPRDKENPNKLSSNPQAFGQAGKESQPPWLAQGWWQGWGIWGWALPASGRSGHAALSATGNSKGTQGPESSEQAVP